MWTAAVDNGHCVVRSPEKNQEKTDLEKYFKSNTNLLRRPQDWLSYEIFFPGILWCTFWPIFVNQGYLLYFHRLRCMCLTGYVQSNYSTFYDSITRKNQSLVNFSLKKQWNSILRVVNWFKRTSRWNFCWQWIWRVRRTMIVKNAR